MSQLCTKKARKHDDGDGGDSIKNVLLVDIVPHQLYLNILFNRYRKLILYFYLQEPEEQDWKNNVKKEVLMERIEYNIQIFDKQYLKEATLCDMFLVQMLILAGLLVLLWQS